MFRYVLIFIVFICHNNGLKSQDKETYNCGSYYLNLAERLFLLEEYQLSSEYYIKSLDSQIHLQEENHIKAIKSLSHCEKWDELSEWIDVIIKSDLLSNFELIRDTALLNLLPPNDRLKINHYLFIKQGCENMMGDRIAEILALDQWIRQDDEAFDKGLYATIDSVFLFSRLDHLLNDILEKGVFLSESNRKYVIVMLRHQTGDPNQFEYFLPRINELKDKEIITSHEYAQVIDAYMIRKTGLQLFGTHFFYDEIEDAAFFKPIESVEKINDRRIELGLLPYFHVIEPLDDSGNGHKFTRPTKAVEIQLYADFIASKCN